MPSLTAKDRTPLCLFSYEDGRRCRTPRISSHPHFCFYHAQKESQSQAAETLADDLAYFFSGKCLTANDLNAALGRLIPAVIRGEIKPRLARTVAYMLQTLMQSTRQAQHEYINAFSTDGWRQAVATSVHNNHDYLYPPNPAPAPTSTACHPERSEGPRQDPAAPIIDETRYPTTRPSPAATEAALAVARALFPERPNNTNPTQPARHTAAAATAPPSQACHPERSEGPRQGPTPSTNTETHLPTTITEPTDPLPPQPPTPRRQPVAPTRDPYAVHYDHTHRLYIDDKPWDGKPR
jgi:hypothetical protein